MDTGINIANEFQENSPLRGVGRKLPFEVPVDYFENLPASISEAAHYENADWGKTTPFAIDGNYFELFEEKISLIVTGSKLLQAGMQMSYSVPESYFNNLPGTLVAATGPKQGATKARKWLRGLPIMFPRQFAAAAAILVILLSAGVYMLTRPATKVENLLATVSKSDLEEYINRNNIDGDAHTQFAESKFLINLDNTAITSYFNETGWDGVE
jgi:hypothetical protein